MTDVVMQMQALCSNLIQELSRTKEAYLHEAATNKLLSLPSIAQRWDMCPKTAKAHLTNYGRLFKIKSLKFSDERGRRWRLSDIQKIEEALLAEDKKRERAGKRSAVSSDGASYKGEIVV